MHVLGGELKRIHSICMSCLVICSLMDLISLYGAGDDAFVEIQTKGYMSVMDRDHLGNKYWKRIAETPGTVQIFRGKPMMFTLRKMARNEDLAELEGLGEIENLSFSFELLNFITRQGFLSVNTLSNISSLQMGRWDWFTGRELTELANLKDLKSLSLYYCVGVNDTMLEYVVEAFPKLESINIEGAEITDKGLEIVSSMRDLRELRLGQCWQITDSGLQNLRVLKNLEGLDLSECHNVTDMGLKYLSNLHRLRSLDLAGCENVDGSGFSDLSELKSIRKLVLAGCRNLKDDGIEYLVAFSELEYLNLAGCEEVTDDGTRQLLELPKLRILFAPDNISTRSFEYFSRMTNLEYILNVDYDNLSKEQREYLKKMPKLIMPAVGQTEKTGSINIMLFTVCIAIVLLLTIAYILHRTTRR